ncbi:hypothetical protein HYS91_01530 [Candidatus Daviesbacteria bacterium]|nr:hypothetical protein [Candidatus Daviesbacteria bacterium]
MMNLFNKIFSLGLSPKTDRLNLYAFLLCLFLALITLIFFLINRSDLPLQLPLFYSLPWGEGQLIFPDQFLILPLIIILITMINSIISWHLHESQLLLKRILLISSAACAFLIFITALRIIYIYV